MEAGLIELWDTAFEKFQAAEQKYRESERRCAYRDPESMDDYGYAYNHKQYLDLMATLSNIEKMSQVDGCLGKLRDREEEILWVEEMQERIKWLGSKIKETRQIMNEHECLSR